ncbi:NAD(P)/FAD-dependent oxidoreductase [Desulfoluna spongiiphila]|uniref:NADH:ubiquinone reductase (non-electrogenic) n=1 Tax=Desulfoluna spongiiphila TaxID=419481 RepID=A0A1G5BJE7_9BACT|nr:NAD(P)/FAD-dependent oxidoreductase [Desulfoluna spongiiphila]SCX90204.1 NADH dehydrogenase [Desulfoluna spongiiphila]VVS93770.1 pyridine nucleotide disulphide reductase class-i signature [Desulfoluna spongiiphila]
MTKEVIIVGGGFAGLKAAKVLGNKEGIQVTLIDKANHHLFQPLLYQVATAGLSQSDIAMPIRSILSEFQNIKVLQGEVTGVDFDGRAVTTDFGTLTYDHLILACGVRHCYFGKEAWEPHAPGLKTLEQALEIRRRILSAFEVAERAEDETVRRRALTFVVVGGGPTGVELAGAIGEMTRYTLGRDFRNIDPKLTRIILVEAGDRILGSFPKKQSSRATRDLENLGVQVWTKSPVSEIGETAIEVGSEKIETMTVLWAAGITATDLNQGLGVETGVQGRLVVDACLNIPGRNDVFVAGDQAAFTDPSGKILPCLSPVAIQQGQCIAENILRDQAGESREPFDYVDKGQMATIGRSRAIVDFGFFRLQGFIAWLTWLLVHIYFISGFNNRLSIFLKWCLSYLTNKKGARIISGATWRFFDTLPACEPCDAPTAPPTPEPFKKAE